MLIYFVDKIKELNVNYKHAEITGVILNAFYTVYNKLGYGFLEKVYERSMLIELKKQGLNCISQPRVPVYYGEEEVGDYFADIIVNNAVIIEVKACSVLNDDHEAQLTNYLKASEIDVGLLINFGKKPQFKRKVFSAEYKNHNRSSKS